MTLFLDLRFDSSGVEPSLSHEENKEILKRSVLEWAETLSDRVEFTKFSNEVRLNHVIVNYASDATSSEDLQNRKRELFEQGIELYFVYPWELKNLPRLFSHFSSRLGLDERTFAAKRLLLEKIPNKEADLFARQNHIQGSASGSQKISYGLRHKQTGELLAVQQYCKSRWMLKSVSENPGIWEGLRLVIKNNVQIHGAATRLQKAFLSEFQPTEIMSYVDYSHSIGGYKVTQGFESSGTSQESYMWVLTKEPVSVTIIDKDGNPRVPDLDIARRTPYLNPNRMAGRLAKVPDKRSSAVNSAPENNFLNEETSCTTMI